MIDYDGFKLKNAPPLSTSKFTLNILQKHYPERMHRIYLCNPPYVFKAFWQIVKPFVDPVTKEKIVFLYGKQSELANNFDDLSKLEACTGNIGEVRPFDSKEYLLELDFAVTFDEESE